MFVLLGLLVTPHDLADDIWPALVIGLVLTMVARPLSVVVALTPFRVPWREQTLLSWAGLRGAVPIILATIPMVSGVEGSRRIFNIVFVLVVVYTLVQGPTLPWLARKLRLGGSGDEAADLGIESAPLERLRGHLLSVAIPEKSRMHGVEVNELRLPRAPPSPSSSATASPSCRCRPRCCDAATNCSSSPRIPSGTRPNAASGPSARAASWPTGWGRGTGRGTGRAGQVADGLRGRAPGLRGGAPGASGAGRREPPGGSLRTGFTLFTPSGIGGTAVHGARFHR